MRRWTLPTWRFAAPDNLPRVGVTFTIHEGEQFFVNQVLLDGLHYTRPGVARREMRVQSGAPLSQQDMLESQRRLYDLGLFKQVDTAIQNPDGTESRKNVLVTCAGSGSIHVRLRRRLRVSDRATCGRDQSAAGHDRRQSRECHSASAASTLADAIRPSP